MKKETDKIGLTEIARLAGVSRMSVSCALRNKPGVSAATRERILRIARESGYTPDARFDNWMARVRDAKSKDLLPIAWLNSSWEKDAWQRYRFHSPFQEGARERALALGYKIEEIWCHEEGMTMPRLAKLLYQRGIEGVIVPLPVRHIRLAWDRLASVSIGDLLLAPRLHRVAPDIYFNLQLALKSLKRLGYRRIGICLPHTLGTISHRSIRDAARSLYASTSKADRVPALFLPPPPYSKKRRGMEKEMVAWLQRVKPEALARGDDHIEQWAEATGFGEKDMRTAVIGWLEHYKPEVIVCHDNLLLRWAEKAGIRVPQDLGLVHLAVDDDVLDWAGIHSQRREMGGAAVEWLVSLMRNHQYGVPKTPLNILIRGTWQSGRTLGSPAAANAETAASPKVLRSPKLVAL